MAATTVETLFATLSDPPPGPPFVVSTSHWDDLHKKNLMVKFKKRDLEWIVSEGCGDRIQFTPATSADLELPRAAGSQMLMELMGECAMRNDGFGGFWQKLSGLNRNEVPARWFAEQPDGSASRASGRSRVVNYQPAEYTDMSSSESQESTTNSDGNYSEAGDQGARRCEDEVTTIEMLVQFLTGIGYNRWAANTPVNTDKKHLACWFETKAVTFSIPFGAQKMSSRSDGGLYVFVRAAGNGPAQACTPRLPLALIEGKARDTNEKLYMQAVGELLGLVFARAESWYAGSVELMTTVERTGYVLCPAGTRFTLVSVTFPVEYLQWIKTGGTMTLGVLPLRVNVSYDLDFAVKMDRQELYLQLWKLLERLDDEWRDILEARM